MPLTPTPTRKKVRELVPEENLRDVREVVASIYARARRTWDRDEAKAIAHEAVTKGFEKLAQHDPSRGAFGPWLQRIADNHLMDRLRARRKEIRMRARAEHLMDKPTRAATPEAELISAQAAAKRKSFLEALPADTYRLFQVVAAQRFDELNRAEAAEALGVTIPEFEAAKKRLPGLLREAMMRQGVRIDDLRSALDPDLDPRPNAVQLGDEAEA